LPPLPPEANPQPPARHQAIRRLQIAPQGPIRGGGAEVERGIRQATQQQIALQTFRDVQRVTPKMLFAVSVGPGCFETLGFT